MKQDIQEIKQELIAAYPPKVARKRNKQIIINEGLPFWHHKSKITDRGIIFCYIYNVNFADIKQLIQHFYDLIRYDHTC